MTLRQRQADVAEAEANLGRVKSKAMARVEARTADFQQAKRQHEAAITRLTEQKDILQQLTILAPQEGIVIYGERRDRRGNVENQVKVGEMAYPRRTLIELPDLTRMNVELQVHQADVTKLEKGQTAWVTIPGRRSEPMKGTVTDIGSIAQSTSWRDPVRRFNVTVQIDERVMGLRAGVTVQCDIDVGMVTNALYIPLQTLASSGGGYFVYVSEGGEPRRRAVKLGSANEKFVEVTEGLFEGDLVLLVNPDIVGEDEEDGKGEKSGEEEGEDGGGASDSGGGEGGGRGSSRPSGER
jgi:RND family efflux transporter MFP subunit